MDMIVQPPSAAQLGTTLQPPVTVRLRNLNSESAEDADNAETANLLAVATLTSDSINDSANPVDPNSLLGGRRFDSIHPFTGEEDDLHSYDTAETRGVGYVSFPDLVIRQEGTYRIRVTLIKIRGAAGEVPAFSGGSSVQAIDSNPITVERNATGLDSGEEGGELLQSLRRRRTRRRSPG